MVRPLPNPAGVHTSPEYRTWFIAAVWPIERPRKNALLSALEGWAQVGTNDADGTDKEIVMAPRRCKVGEGLAPKDDIEHLDSYRLLDFCCFSLILTFLTFYLGL
ncbi:hypothetical protein JCGZ_26701 [Jatropha curcas]|uniref:Uncharacterized protein n=1 Tax=Jatropha curcas TaxID=180498 RepID=A0A067JXJ7_JATCU|nr:hypothetical protein JCGZ_26701 [Jatropha curcas]